MSTEKILEEFEFWWYDHKQKELRQSCAIGWGLVIWQASRAAIEVELRDAYMKGWEMSGEGWNGEYPAMLHETERWQRERDEALGIEP